MTIQKIAIAMMVPPITALLMSCAGIPTDKPRFQGFSLHNSGASAVTEVKIQYGNFLFPFGTARNTVRAAPWDSAHETETVPVPETAQIHWRSSDGQVHDIVVPIKSLITNWDTFHGFKFIFADSYVELAVENRHETPPPYGSLDYTKVYSSKDGAIKQ